MITKKIKSYLQLMRIKHWLKNVIVFIPAFYGGVITQGNKFVSMILGFIVFSLCSSAIYIINDLCDIEKDSNHPVKRFRPLASGAVTKFEGYALLIVCVLISTGLNLCLFKLKIGYEF